MLVFEETLRFAGEKSTYEAALPELARGTYDVEVLASEPVSANFGRVAQRVVIE